MDDGIESFWSEVRVRREPEAVEGPQVGEPITVDQQASQLPPWAGTSEERAAQEELVEEPHTGSRGQEVETAIAEVINNLNMSFRVLGFPCEVTIDPEDGWLTLRFNEHIQLLLDTAERSYTFSL
jgi:hypothetical protein